MNPGSAGFCPYTRSVKATMLKNDEQMNRQKHVSYNFHVKNLDCPSCSSKIEDALTRSPAISEARLDPVSMKLFVKAIPGEDKKIREIVAKTNPRVVLTEPGSISKDEKEFQKPDFSGLVLVISAFLVVLVFEYMLGESLAPEIIWAIALCSYMVAGFSVLKDAWLSVRRGDLFNENTLMSIATIGALFLGAKAEAVGVMAFYRVGEFFQDIATARAVKSIRAVLATKPDTALIIKKGKEITVPADTLKPGDLVIVKPGMRIPADGHVVSGSSSVDTSPLTGESVPVKITPGKNVRAGEINLSGVFRFIVEKPLAESIMAKTISLVESAIAKKAKTEAFITRFARIYTPCVLFFSVAVAILPPLLLSGQSWSEWLYRSLVVLVISCPCALVLSIPLSYFAGLGRAARSGILMKGSVFLDILAKVKTVVFDKTGTLTQGRFEVLSIHPENNYTAAELLSLAAHAEHHSSHPIAGAILSAYEKEGSGKVDSERISGFETLDGGIRVEIDSMPVLVGNDGLMHRYEIPHDSCLVSGTVAHVAVSGKYAGYILIGDKIRPESRKAVDALRDLGVDRIIMLTGDNDSAASNVARTTGVDMHYADLMPSDKAEILERLFEENKDDEAKIAFVGDGINDAAAIARADVGIAMGGIGSDAAVETADVVLATDDPFKTALAVAIGKKTHRIVYENITGVLFIKLLAIALGTTGVLGMWGAVFADVGAALLAVVNSMRLLSYKYSQTK